MGAEGQLTPWTVGTPCAACGGLSASTCENGLCTGNVRRCADIFSPARPTEFNGKKYTSCKALIAAFKDLGGADVACQSEWYLLRRGGRGGRARRRAATATPSVSSGSSAQLAQTLPHRFEHRLELLVLRLEAVCTVGAEADGCAEGWVGGGRKRASVVFGNGVDATRLYRTRRKRQRSATRKFWAATSRDAK